MRDPATKREVRRRRWSLAVRHGDGEGSPLRKSEGEAYPRRGGDRAGGGIDDIGGRAAHPPPRNGGLGDQLR